MNQKNRKRPKRFLYATAIIVALWGIYPYIHITIFNTPYEISQSPDEKYSLEYYHAPFTPFGFPFYSITSRLAFAECCFPGYIRLVNNQTDSRISGVFYESTYGFSKPRWYPDSVSLIGFYRFKFDGDLLEF